MISYPVLIERVSDGFWVHAPGIPGCVSFGQTRTEALEAMKEAVEGHLELLRERGVPAPEPTASVGSVEVAIDPPRE